MNPKLAGLHLYPFQKLAKLTRDITPPAHKSAISYALGEPKHAAPAFILDEIKAHLPTLSSYPTTRGLAALRAAIAAWAMQRFGLDRVALDPERHILPACGTREALFSIVQAVIDSQKTRQPPVVIIPNPFYQIYEGAALLAGAEVYYLNTLTESNYKMDFSRVPKTIWERTQLVFTCSPGNPTGAVMNARELEELIRLAQQYDFIIAADECYSEIYFDEDAPPPGLLQVANSLGIDDYRHCLVFHSLSKRSNLPGLRSGFIAGDGDTMTDYLRYRTYQGCSLHALAQAASIKVWSDEAHVRDNRAQYRAKFAAVLEILSPVMRVQKPDASFYLWPQTPIDDEQFTRGLLARENVLVLPGRYLSREAEGVNPGHNRVRMALVAPHEECVQAARRIRDYVTSL